MENFSNLEVEANNVAFKKLCIQSSLLQLQTQRVIVNRLCSVSPSLRLFLQPSFSKKKDIFFFIYRITVIIMMG